MFDVTLFHPPPEARRGTLRRFLFPTSFFGLNATTMSVDPSEDQENIPKAMPRGKFVAAATRVGLLPVIVTLLRRFNFLMSLIFY